MKKIVVIDDDPSIVALLKSRLESNGYAVTVAADGNAGLGLIRTILPDLAIIDVMMPGMDGYSLLSEIRSDDALRHVPVIVASVRGEIGDVFMNEGVAAFFLKPLSTDDVLAKIRELVG